MSHLPRPVPLDERARTTAQSVARHEAGHYVVGRVLGFQTGDITIQLFYTFQGPGHKGGASITLHEETSTLEAVQLYLERRVQVLYAGVLAEAMNVQTGEIDAQMAIKHLKEGGASDHIKAREAMQLIRNIRHGRADSDEQVQAQLQAIHSELWNKAGEIVTTEGALIKSLSIRLRQMVKNVGPEYVLSADELDRMDGIRDRFSVQDEGKD